MKWSWEDVTKFILFLSQLGLYWYRVVNGNDDIAERAVRKAVSRILDPETPENTVDELKANGLV